MSTMRLTAKPVNVKINAPIAGRVGESEGGERAVRASDGAGRDRNSDGLGDNAGLGLEGLRGNERQAAFLERLAEIKRAKGEEDTVPMVGVRSTPKKPVRDEGGGRGRGRRGKVAGPRAGRGFSGRGRLSAASGHGAGGGLQEAVDEGAVASQAWEELGDNGLAAANVREEISTERLDETIEQEEPQGENVTDDAVSLIRTAEDIDMEDVQ